MDVKDKIIIKSDSLFRKFGIRGVTIDDICSELGISKKTIYIYFDDKHSIALGSIKYYWSGLLNEIVKINPTNSGKYLGTLSLKIIATIFAPGFEKN